MVKLTEVVLTRMNGQPPLTLELNPKFPKIGANAEFLRERLRSYSVWALTTENLVRHDWLEDGNPEARFLRVPFRIGNLTTIVWGFDNYDDREFFLRNCPPEGNPEPLSNVRIK